MLVVDRRQPVHEAVGLVRLKLKRELTFYTDGSCWPNPGPGGWAVIERRIDWAGEDEYLPVAGGHDLLTTNVKMEGVAIIEAMRLGLGEPTVIITDSLLWVDTITQWAPKWRENGWKKRDGEHVKNLSLVKQALTAYEAGDYTLQHVRGHQGIPGNEAADAYAEVQRQQQLAQNAALRAKADATPAEHRDLLRSRAR